MKRLVNDHEVPEGLVVEGVARRGPANIQYGARSADGREWRVKLPFAKTAHKEDALARELLGSRIAAASDLRVPETKLVRLDAVRFEPGVFLPPNDVFVAQEEIPLGYRPVSEWSDVPVAERLKLLVYGSIVVGGEERFVGNKIRDVGLLRGALILFDLEGMNRGYALVDRVSKSAASSLGVPTVAWSSAIAAALEGADREALEDALDRVAVLARSSATMSEWTRELSLLGTDIHVGRICDWLGRNVRQVRDDLLVKLMSSGG